MESLTKNKKSNEEILSMLQKAFGDNLTLEEVQIKELTGGFFNVAYEVIMRDQTVILKIAPPSNIKVMSYEHNMMRAEAEAMQLVYEKTSVPVPKVLYYDASHSVCNADYFFMEKIEGESFFELNMKELISSDVQKQIYKEVGRYSKEINQIKGERFGYYALTEKQGDSWKEVFLQMLEEVLQDGERVDISLGISYEEVRKLVLQASPVLEEVKEPYLVHWDLWDGNVFVQDNVLSGIIDFERAMWADPLMEFNFRGHNNIEEFYKGYGSNLREAAPVRSLLYDIYLFAILIIETNYRFYPDDWQLNFATEQLEKTITALRQELEK